MITASARLVCEPLPLRNRFSNFSLDASIFDPSVHHKLFTRRKLYSPSQSFHYNPSFLRSFYFLNYHLNGLNHTNFSFHSNRTQSLQHSPKIDSAVAWQTFALACLKRTNKSSRQFLSFPTTTSTLKFQQGANSMRMQFLFRSPSTTLIRNACVHFRRR